MKDGQSQLLTPDGTIDGRSGTGNAGLPFTTLLPRFAVAYVSHGWTFSNNIVGEYNTTNPVTGYRSGFVLRDEASITRTFGRVSFGPAITYIGQVANDKSSAFYNYAVHVNRFSLVGVGGIVGYDIGPASISVYGISDIVTTASGGTPTTAAGRDSASQIGGFTVFAAINFKIPGIGALGTPVNYNVFADALTR